MKSVALSFAAALTLAATCSSLFADEPRVMREDEVSVDTVVDQLAPKPVLKMRGIQKSSQPQQPASPPSLSIMITFKTNSSDLAPEAKKSLDIVGQALNSEKLGALKFDIEGHADPRGNHDYNLKLSQARAEAVRHYLSDKLEVKSERLSAIGKGDQEPFVRDNPADPRNRRVTFKTLVE